MTVAVTMNTSLKVKGYSQQMTVSFPLLTFQLFSLGTSIFGNCFPGVGINILILTKAFSDCFQMSLYHIWVLPVGLFPVAS